MNNPQVKAALISSPRRILTGSGRSFLYLSTAFSGNVLRCSMCDKPILPGQNYNCDRYNHAVCSDHEVTFCAVCQRIILGDRILVPNLGFTCTACGTPRSVQELTTVVNTIYTFFKEKQIFLPAYSMKLLSAHEMDEKYRKRFGFMPFGVAWDDYPGGYQARPGAKRYHIDLMSQQSPISLARTLAHEVLHLWQYHRGIKAPAHYAEGFCNLGAYQVIARLFRSPEAMVLLKCLMEDHDPKYGVAFRELKVMHDISGWESVVAAMKSFATQPQGL